MEQNGEPKVNLHIYDGEKIVALVISGPGKTREIHVK